MLYALKGNKEVVIDDSEINGFVEKGFTVKEIIDGVLQLHSIHDKEETEDSSKLLESKDAEIFKLNKVIENLKKEFKKEPKKTPKELLQEEAKSLGIEFDVKATIEEIKTLIEAKKLESENI